MGEYIHICAIGAKGKRAARHNPEMTADELKSPRNCSLVSTEINLHSSNLIRLSAAMMQAHPSCHHMTDHIASTTTLYAMHDFLKRLVAAGTVFTEKVLEHSPANHFVEYEDFAVVPLPPGAGAGDASELKLLQDTFLAAEADVEKLQEMPAAPLWPVRASTLMLNIINCCRTCPHFRRDLKEWLVDVATRSGLRSGLATNLSDC